MTATEQTRVTVDFADEPDALKALKDRAKKEKRSLGRQLLVDCLPGILTASFTRAAPKRKPRRAAK